MATVSRHLTDPLTAIVISTEQIPGDPGSEVGKIVTPDVDITVYKHYPEDGSTPYLVLDIDSESEGDSLSTPMRIYRNDGPVYEEAMGDHDLLPNIIDTTPEA